MMAAMRHPNVVLYLGVCLDPPCVVTEYCARGSLNDVLKRALYNSKYAEQLDWRVRCGLTPALSHTAFWKLPCCTLTPTTGELVVLMSLVGAG